MKGNIGRSSVSRRSDHPKRGAIAHYKIGQIRSPVPMSDSIQQEARQILDILFKSHRKARPMRSTTLEQLSATDAEAILEHLPERICAALIARAAEIEYPIEAVVEMAIASFLDSEALGFADCKPGRGH